MSDNRKNTIEDELAQFGTKRSAFADFFVRLWKEKPLGTVGLVIVLLLFFIGIFADLLAPYGVNEINLKDLLQGSSAEHWLGTDQLGRDLLSRVIYGARISMVVGVSVAFTASVLSATIGILCGYIGGRFDIVVQRFVDAWMAFPMLVILLTMMAILGSGLTQIIIVLSFTFGIGGSRIMRSMVVRLKQEAYIEAAKAIGASTRRILFRHILPNVLPLLIIGFSGSMSAIILTEASLSFLGFGIPPPEPSWGGMIAGPGRSYMLLAPGMGFWPGLALSIVVYGVNMFGDAARDLLDPRLRGGIGRYAGATKKMKVLQAGRNDMKS